ncbi:MAG: SIS domain-containing protein [Aminobacterium colombiense]|jgi:D-sedoheptulose 7-phosphate isomerase|uniref:Phosphoheptose isomerase n=1 Tax=Aminobacterium colombiense (strain DSM 12261 / ALA-1) TaxID=572547 RepID=D5EFZ6_AMICL|nr:MULTISPECIES: SIS domain-containing protein [Aminobacterium]ADE57478.1 phosphoheptose isomerase [Aminobacterium colombiense DSM 12261]MDD4265083.1 SIS domain-containing protein [Aminobacterium colombiense]NLK30328.1 SIS domain-containing protein [Aminobacterium colombiense]
MIEKVQKQLQESINVKIAALSLAEKVASASQLIIQALSHGGTAFFLGNGGSAADAQHLAAELVGRFEKNRKALRAVALTTNPSTITALANDYGYENIFLRQLQALAAPGDIVIGISTGGASPNVVKALTWAKEKGIETIAMTGENGGDLARIASLLLTAPSSHTPRIQELHITWGHIICGLIEEALCSNG